MTTMRFMEIGILLMQIDIEQCLLARLFTEKRLRSVKAYQHECKRIEKLRNQAWRELEELGKQRYWRGPKIR